MIMIAVAMLIALILCLLSGVPYIEFLKKHLYGQYIREEVAQTHAKKSGTPTTGGAFMIFSLVFASVVALSMAQTLDKKVLIVLMTVIFYTFTGFKDDMTKIKEHRNKGLSAKGKFLLQNAVALLPALYIVLTGKTAVTFGSYSIELGFWAVIFAIFLIVGTSNALNLTDGLDGLASSCALFSFLGCASICYMTKQEGLAIISAAAAAVCLGFLYFNRHPAKVFMGDTGSLALGGLLGTIAVVGKFELWLIPLGLVFILETLSVMIQVTSFKTTGKRIFKMTPIHHHFELLGWNEEKIVRVFASVNAISCVIAVWGFYFTRNG